MITARTEDLLTSKLQPFAPDLSFFNLALLFPIPESSPPLESTMCSAPGLTYVSRTLMQGLHRHAEWYPVQWTRAAGERPVKFCFILEGIWYCSAHLLHQRPWFFHWTWRPMVGVVALQVLLMLADNGQLLYVPLIPLLDLIFPQVVQSVYHFVLITLPAFMFSYLLSLTIFVSACLWAMVCASLLTGWMLFFLIESTVRFYPVVFVCLAWAKVYAELLGIGAGYRSKRRALRQASEMRSTAISITQADEESDRLMSTVDFVTFTSLVALEHAWAALDASSTDRLEYLEWDLPRWCESSPQYPWSQIGPLYFVSEVVQPLRQQLQERSASRTPPSPSLAEGSAREIERLAGVLIHYLLPLPSLQHLNQPLSMDIVLSIALPRPLRLLLFEMGDFYINFFLDFFRPPRSRPSYEGDFALLQTAIEAYLVEALNTDLTSEAAAKALDDCLRFSAFQKQAKKDQVRLDGEILTAVLRWKERKNGLIKQRLEQA